MRVSYEDDVMVKRSKQFGVFKNMVRGVLVGLLLAGTLSPVMAQGGLTREALRNATYALDGPGTVTLVDGLYQHQYGAGASEVDTVGVQSAAPGDLDGDGAEDAAVVLWHNGGGSGTFIHLVAVRNDGGSPLQVATVSLGDRTYVYDLAVQNQQIVVRALVHAGSDPLCCPSLAEVMVFTLAGDALVLVTETGLGQMVSAGGDVSFALPYGLAASVTGNRAPAGDDLPAHVRVDFPGYLPERGPDAQIGENPAPHLRVFDTAAFAAFPDSNLNGALDALQGLVSARPALRDQVTLPYLPPLAGIPAMHAKEAYLSFAGGAGIRYLTVHTPESGTLAEATLLYTFQGLTEDGRFYVALALPLDASILPEGSMADSATLTAALDGQPGAAFAPTLDALDTLVQTLFVSPLALQ